MVFFGKILCASRANNPSYWPLAYCLKINNCPFLSEVRQKYCPFCPAILRMNNCLFCPTVRRMNYYPFCPTVRRMELFRLFRGWCHYDAESLSEKIDKSKLLNKSTRLNYYTPLLTETYFICVFIRSFQAHFQRLFMLFISSVL